MSAMYDQQSAPPLGFWRIFRETFAMSFRHFGLFALIAVPPWAVIIVLALLLDEAALLLVLAFVGCFLWAMTCSVLTLAAYQIKSELPVDLPALARRALSSLPPMLFCCAIAIFAINFAMNFFFVPGIYVSGIFAVVLPAAVIENQGMQSIPRSEELSRRYRWSTGGLWMLVAVVLPTVVIIVASIAFASVAVDIATPEQFTATAWISTITGFTIFNIITCVLATLIYDRLLEIETGYSKIEDVFG